MKVFASVLRLLSALAFLLLASALSTSAFATPGPLVLAAASLQESVSAAADRWAAKGHARPVVSFAASSALARQVAAGAPADLFISADEQWMDDLAKRGLLRPATRATLATGALVLVAPAGSRAALRIAPGFPLARALGGRRLALADPASVPAGIYARQALTRLGLWPQVAGRIASAENVRAALALVARGEVPFGIVYLTDALAEPRVRIVGRFPAASHAPITYPLAILKAARNGDTAAFRAFLLSGEGGAIFRHFGFGTR